MADTRYLKKRRQGWYFYLAVPADLRAKLGKSTITETLATRDLSKAQKLRWSKLTQWTDAFERLRGNVELTGAEIEDHAQRMFQSYLIHLDTLAKAGTYKELNEIEQLELEAGLLADASEENDATPVAADIFEIAKRTGAELLPGTPTYRRLARALRIAKYHAVRGRIAALEGKQWDVPATFAESHIDLLTLLPKRGATAARPRKVGQGIRFSEAAARFIAEAHRDPAASVTEQTRGQHEAVYRLFTQFAGDAFLEDVTPESASEFLQVVSKLHPHWGRSPATKTLTLWELLERHGNGEQQLSNRTLNRYVSSLSAVFKWAKQRGHLSRTFSNPFSEQRYAKPPLAASRWMPYTPSELRIFLNAPLMVQTPQADRLNPPKQKFRYALLWLQLLALFTGMRSNELCQLHTTDVLEKEGIPYFRVHAEREGQRLKTEAAERVVPIHSTLIECGFLQYVSNLPKGQLFPALKPGGPDGKFNWYLAKQFPAYRRDLGITRERVSFHSFRKNAAQALKDARTTPSEIAELIGHERGFTVETYAPLGLPLPVLKDIVERISYAAVSFEHLRASV